MLYQRPNPRKLVLLLCLALLPLVLDLLAFRLHGPAYRLAVGDWGDHVLLSGFHGRERDARDVSFRWSAGQGQLSLAGVAAVPAAVLTLEVGGTPPEARSLPAPVLHVEQAQALPLPTDAEPRRHRLLLPARVLLDGDLQLLLSSPTFQVGTDPRQLGIFLRDIELGWAPARWALPGWRLLLAQWGLLLVGAGCAWRLGFSRRATLTLLVALALLSAYLAGRYLFLATPWLARLLGAGLLLLLLAWQALPLLQRLVPALADTFEARRLAGVTLLLTLLRLLGALYPGFEAHDQSVHVARLVSVQLGELLLTGRPAEFGNNLTVIPAGLYVLLLPFTLLVGDTMVLVQAAYTVIDGLGALLVALLVRQLGGSARAALIALLLVASLPVSLTILWWGFAPQIAGQWLLVLIALLMARPSGGLRRWAPVTALLLLALLLHPGVAPLAWAWIAAYILLNVVFQRQVRGEWAGWMVVLVVSTLLAIALVYFEMVQLYLTPQLEHVTERAFGEEPAAQRIERILGGLRATFRPLGPLAGLGLLLLLHLTRGRQRYLALAWIGSAVLFFAVDLLTNLQVRYGYFAVPIVTAGLALGLDQLMRRWRWTRLAGWVMLMLICLPGWMLWYHGVLYRVKPTLTALTH